MRAQRRATRVKRRRSSIAMTTSGMDKGLTFWEHLDSLRSLIIRIALVAITMGGVAFALKDRIFEVIFAPRNSDFITYRLFDWVTTRLNTGGDVAPGGVESFNIEIINTELTQQFTTHIQMAMYIGFLVVFPYILYEIFRFISPALYASERRSTVAVICWGYVMFILGVAMSYYMIFPLTFRFLATYQVSDTVVNMISLDSYIGTLMTLSIMMGVVFEMPILCWFFAKLGLLSALLMRQFRRYAIVTLVLIAAIITPTADIVTLLLVTLPMYLLYEISIGIVAMTNREG